jgi:hypothetical protein
VTTWKTHQHQDQHTHTHTHTPTREKKKKKKEEEEKKTSPKQQQQHILYLANPTAKRFNLCRVLSQTGAFDQVRIQGSV